MDRKRAQELLPIITAFAEGKAIQFRFIRGGFETREWLNCPENEDLMVTFPASDYEYRIKPEPREWWVFPHTTTEPYIARDTLPPGVSGYGWIKVREIIE